MQASEGSWWGVDLHSPISTSKSHSIVFIANDSVPRGHKNVIFVVLQASGWCSGGLDPESLPPEVKEIASYLGINMKTLGTPVTVEEVCLSMHMSLILFVLWVLSRTTEDVCISTHLLKCMLIHTWVWGFASWYYHSFLNVFSGTLKDMCMLLKVWVHSSALWTLIGVLLSSWRWGSWKEVCLHQSMFSHSRRRVYFLTNTLSPPPNASMQVLDPESSNINPTLFLDTHVHRHVGPDCQVRRWKRWQNI